MNSISEIKNECIKDHLNYIESYVNTYKNDVLPEQYGKGIKNYQEIKQLLKQLMIQYPQLMSFLMNFSESNMNTNTLSNAMITQTGGSIEEVDEALKSIKEIFLKYSQTDIKQIDDKVKDIMTTLDVIELKVKDISKNNDSSSILNNLQSVLTTLEAYDPTKKTYKTMTKGIDIYVPPKISSKVSKSINFSTVLDQYTENILKDLIDNGEDVSKQLIDVIHNKKGDAMYRAILNKYLTADTINPKLNIKVLEDKYNQINGESKDKIKEIKTVYDSIQLSLTQTNEYIYGDNTNKVNKINTKIRAHILPKIRTMMSWIKLYKQTKYDKIIEIYDNIPFTKINYYQKFNVVRKLTNINKDNINNLISFIKENEVGNDILNFTERFRGESVGQMDKFIDKYNDLMNSIDGINEINMFMAMQYHQIINKTVDKEIHNKLRENELTQLNAKILKQFPLDRFRTEPNKVIDKVKDILNKNYYSNIDEKTLHQNNIRNHLKDISLDMSEPTVFIYNYNQMIYEFLLSNKDIKLHALADMGLPESIRLIPNNYFTGAYTDTISNKIFEAIDSYRQEKTDLLKDLVNLNTIEGKIMFTNPDFNKLDQHLKKAEEIRGLNGMQTGGDNGNDIDTVIEYMMKIGNINIEINNMIDEYNEKVKLYNINYNDIYSYTRFLILIATNQLFTNLYVVYVFMNKGIVEFFRRIIRKIVVKIELINVVELTVESTKSTKSTESIKYMRKYYNVVIRRLDRLLENLTVNMMDSLDVIDINHIINSDLKNDFILLNYFKPIIESYNETFQNKITIYSRLNDIPDLNNVSDKLSLTSDVSFDHKIFLSDHEMVENVGCGYRHSKLDKSDKVDESECQRNTGSSMMGNSQVMWVNKEACTAYDCPKKSCQSAIMKCSYEKEGCELEPVLFTQVFDSVNFVENGDISKYMTLETQLAKKKGICLMTYGYSGTGKTFTLFGNGKTQGMLQSTLDNINGLEEVKFRLFEIYGLGLPYDFYWNNKTQSRMDKIYHKIFHYNLQTHTKTDADTGVIKGDLSVIEGNDIVEIDATNFAKYISNQYPKINDSYTTISRSFITPIFRNFSEFTSSIDEFREGKKGIDENIKKIRRIRDTPNNNISSRSILVYDFKLYIGNKTEENAVKFLIIDLPGREEIGPTYIDPYLGNPVIKDIIKDAHQLEKAKMIITCSALNPLAISVFKPTTVIDYINSLSEDDRKTIIDRKLLNESILNDSKRTSLNIWFDINNQNKIIRTESNAPGLGYNNASNDLQLKGVASIFLMNRLVENNRFDIIEKIYEKVINEEINKKITNEIKTYDNQQIYDLILKILTNKFKGEKSMKIINQIYDVNVNDKEIKLIGLIPYIQNHKNDLVKKIKDDDKDKIINLLKYDYFLTPLEGIYINENIIGLIKYLSDNLVKETEETEETKETNKTKNIIEKQMEMTLDYQRNITRTWLMSKPIVSDYKGETSHSDTNVVSLDKLFEFYNGIKNVYQESYFKTLPGQPSYSHIPENNRYYGLYKWNGKEYELNYDNMRKQQQNMIGDYVAFKIFNNEKPLITDILSYYIPSEKKTDTNVYDNKIYDFKIFYLFGNYEDSTKTDFKCQHQVQLLKDTKNFINAIV